MAEVKRCQIFLFVMIKKQWNFRINFSNYPKYFSPSILLQKVLIYDIFGQSMKNIDAPCDNKEILECRNWLKSKA